MVLTGAGRRADVEKRRATSWPRRSLDDGAVFQLVQIEGSGPSGRWRLLGHVCASNPFRRWLAGAVAGDGSWLESPSSRAVLARLEMRIDYLRGFNPFPVLVRSRCMARMCRASTDGERLCRSQDFARLACAVLMLSLCCLRHRAGGPAPRRCRACAGRRARSRQRPACMRGGVAREQDTVAGRMPAGQCPGTGSRQAVCQTFDDGAGLGGRDPATIMPRRHRKRPRALRRLDQNSVVATATNPSSTFSPSTSIPVPIPMCGA